MANASKSQDNPVLHVVVIGFHHKKGCQVEYSYPPLIEGGPVDSNDVPPEWRHLASLALPDGAHNHMQDTIYFHLPARFAHHRTVYGVACYRQMDAKDLVNKTDDVTRSTVQKSVCVLSKLPLYGLIQAKLELITHAYFDECDFTKVELLEEMYKNLNLSLKQSLLDGGSHVYLGMSARDVVTSFKHRIILLFKLILLERKVLFTGGPVKKIVNTLLSVLSLFPGMIESGLTEAAMYNVNKSISPTLKTTSFGQGDTEEFLEISEEFSGSSSGKATVGSTRADLSLSFNDALSDSVRHSDFVEELDTPESLNQIDKEDCFSWEEDRLHLFIDHEIDGQERERHPKEEVSLVSSFKDDSILEKSSKKSHGSTGSQSDGKDMDSAMATVGSKDGSTRESSPVSVGSAASDKSTSAIKNRLSSAFSGIGIRQKLKTKVGSKDETSQPASPENDNTIVPVLLQDDFGFPLAIFAKGSICHPYLSLQYFDLLSDINVRSFVIGATNILFKQKRHLTDVVIDVHAKLVEDFGVQFIQAWKTTHNYRYWTGSEHPGMKDVPCGHPCQGNLGVADIRVRLAHTMQSTERGKKLNAAVNQTGKYVVQTGKAVGGALTHAKSAVSSWFSSLTSDWRHNDKQQGVVEADQAEEGKDS
ncbi:hypothetical protein ACJMK2_023218 [Sinanodonta woodiana]|uniref:UDENN domain-containing protein n=1 Tax=Sinanodonta woodiana TaxID=1069815 RepID=A0ABD3T4G4_SINWO